MSDSLKGRPRARVAYLGPPASFSHQASLGIFQSNVSPSSAELISAASFADIFDAVKDSEHKSEQPGICYGVVPVENSSNGSVVQILDLLADHEGRYDDVKVCAEYYLPVHHFLLVFPKSRKANGPESKVGNFSGIAKLYTHPQVWGQCSRFLTKHMKGVERIDLSSTSKAAHIVNDEKSEAVAAIASRLAGEVNGLDVAAENIEDEGNNTTRFFVLYNSKGPRLGAYHATDGTTGGRTTAKWKSLISFTIAHESPGSLADALAVFKEFNFNLTSIDTRPSRQKPWHYVFFVECEETRMVGDEENLKKMLRELEKHAESTRYLGCWEDQLGTTK